VPLTLATRMRCHDAAAVLATAAPCRSVCLWVGKLLGVPAALFSAPDVPSEDRVTY